MNDRDHVTRNRELWAEQARSYEAAGERQWASSQAMWGIGSIPEADAGLLAVDVAGTDTIELGCGTAHVSAWLARRGARPVGIDNSRQQLTTARRLQHEHELRFPWKARKVR